MFSLTRTFLVPLFILVSVWIGAADLDVLEDAAHGGRFGLRVSTAGEGPTVLTDASPTQLHRLVVQFYFRADNLTLPEGSRVPLFSAVDGAGREQIRLFLERGDNPQLTYAVRQDDGSVVETPAGAEIPLEPGWRGVQFTWRAGPGDGSFEIALDGAEMTGLKGLANEDARIETTLLGLSGTLPAGLTGVLDYDDYESREAGDIEVICFTPAQLSGNFLEWPQHHSVLYLVSIFENVCVTE